jgi:hypothetical protein
MSNLTLYNYCKETVELVQKIQGGFIDLAERLHKIKTERMWENGYSSWEEFCDEMKLSYSTIQKLIQIYDTFVLKYGVKTSRIASVGGWSILAEGLSIIKTKVDAEAFLTDASVLSLRDIRKNVTAQKKGLPASYVCKHANTYKIEICKDCGEKWEIYEKNN